jgi:hypothetical protein
MRLIDDSLNIGGIAGILIVIACGAMLLYIIWESTHMKNKKK